MSSVKLPLLFILSIFFCFPSCLKQEGQQVEKLSSSLPAYELIGKPVVPPGIGLALSVQALPESGEQLQLRMIWKNSRKEPLYINSTAATLLSQEGWRTSPERAASEPVRLLPGTTDTILLQFKPISNMQLYKLTGARGALAKQYRLPLFFVEDAKGNALLSNTLHFQLPDSLYQQYLRLAGEAQPIKLYKLHPDRKQEEQLTLRLQKLFRDSKHSGGARIMEEEIFMAGLNVRVGVFEKNDTLTMNLRMVNHSPFSLYLTPSLVGLRKTNNELVAYEKMNEQPVQLKKGERFTVLKKYKEQQEADSLWLTLEGITLTDKKNSLLEGRLLLTKWEP